MGTPNGRRSRSKAGASSSPKKTNERRTSMEPLPPMDDRAAPPEEPPRMKVDDKAAAIEEKQAEAAQEAVADVAKSEQLPTKPEPEISDKDLAKEIDNLKEMITDKERDKDNKALGEDEKSELEKEIEVLRGWLQGKEKIFVE